MKKSAMAQFSFLMVLIPVLGEALLDTLDLLKGELVVELGWVPMVVGFLAAFVSGAAACKWMIGIVRRQKLTYFAIYCLAAGALAIIWQFCH